MESQVSLYALTLKDTPLLTTMPRPFPRPQSPADQCRRGHHWTSQVPPTAAAEEATASSILGQVRCLVTKGCGLGQVMFVGGVASVM